MGVKERYEKRQQEGTVSYSGVEQRYKAKESKNVASSIKDRVGTWLKNHNNYVSNYHNRFSRRNYSYGDSYVSDSDSWLDTVKKQKDNFDAEAESILSYMDQYKGYLNEDWMKFVRDTLTGARDQQGVIVNAATEDRDFWSSFTPTEEQSVLGQTAEDIYAAWYKDDSYRQKYKGKSYTEINDTVAAMEDGEERNWLSENITSFMTTDDYDNELAQINKQLQKVQAELHQLYNVGGADYFTEEEISRGYQLQASIESLSQKKAKYENERKYSFIPENEDFTQTSVYRDEYADDSDYVSVNNKEGKAKYMTEDELGTYNTLYHTEGKAAAEAYEEYLQPELNARKQSEKRIKKAVYATEQPGWADLESVGATLLSGVGYLDVLGQRIIKDVSGDYYAPVDYNTDAMTPAIAASAIRGTRAQNIAADFAPVLDTLGVTNENGVITLDENEHPFLSKVFNGRSAGDVYQLGMSMVDSAATAALSPVLGSASTALLGGSAATQGMLNAAANGATDGQALAIGFFNGAAEMIFEKYSLESLLNRDTTNVIEAVLRQGLAEGSEETFTSIANNVADILIMAEKSGYQKNVQEYRNQGYSESEAVQKAILDMGIDTGWDFLGGMLTGGIMGGTATAGKNSVRKLAETVTVNKQYKNAGKNIVANAAGVEHLTALANELDGVSAYGLGKQAQSVSKKATSKNVGKLLTDIKNTVNEQNSKELTARLQEKGIAADRAASIAEAVIVARSDRSSLTQEQVSLLKTASEDAVVVEAVGEILDTEDSTAYKRTAQLQSALLEIQNTVSQTENINADGTAQSLQELARETVADRYADEETVSAEGHAILNDEAVDIADVAEVGNGKVSVKLTDGRTVDATKLDFEDSGEAELWRVIGKYAADAESARALLEEYRGGELDAYKYARGVEEAFLYGKLNISPREMAIQGSYVNMLNPTQKNMAYKQGVIAGQKQMSARQSKVDNANEKSGKKKGELHFEGDRGKLTKRQKVSLQTCEVVAKALGIQVYVFESDKVAGTRVGENGWYNPADSSIHIDLYAGQNGEGVMVFTLAHELTHFIRDWSPTKFQTLSKFLAEQYAKKGQNVSDLVRLQQKKAAEDGRTLSFEEAHEEWVADSMETMLTDGTIVEKLSMLQTKDAGLVEKIKTFLMSFVKRLKEAYQMISPQTTEGRIVADMVDAAQELQNLFADALLDAGENFQTAEKNTTDEGGVKFSVRYSDAIEKLSDGTLDRTDNTHLKLLDNTPQLYVDKAGAKNLKIIMAWDVAYLAMNKSGNLPGNYHGLGKDVMKQLPDAIENPLYIVKQKNGRVAAVTEIVVKGKKPVLASIELDTYKTTRQGGVYEDENYNLILTVMDAHPRYLNNTIFSGEVVYNKNNEAPAHFIARLKTLNKAVPTNDPAKASKSSIRNSEGNVKENDLTEKRNSSRSGNVSDREMLVDLFEQTVTDSNEYKALQNYKKNIDRMMALEEHLERLSEEIKRLSFAEGPRDMELLNNLKLQQKKAVEELNRYDNQLLQLEKSGVLRAMVERNRKLITQKSMDKAREYYRQKNEKRETEIRQYYRESRRQAVERHDKAQVRQQIRKDVQRLDSLLNKGTKEKNVKLELQDFAGAALRTAKGAFLKNYDEYDMVRSGVGELQGREQKAVFYRCQELLQELDMLRIKLDPENIHEKWDPEEQLRLEDREEALKKELAKNMAVLRNAGVFKAENERIEDAVSEELMDELMAAYKALQKSESAHVRGVFNSAIYNQMESVKEFLAGKAIKDMTAIELGKLKDMYRMVLHTITTSNELFKQKKKTDVRTKGEKVIKQLRTKVMEDIPVLLEKIASFGWSNLSLDTALELIGSDELTDTAQALYEAEDTYQTDLEHAKDYAEKTAKKYGRKNWDVSKTVRFAGTEITLGQAMSLYAYTKRKQSQGHLEGEGFTHSKNVRFKRKKGNIPVELTYIKNAVLTYKVTKEQYAELEKLLTKPQREYVEAMVEYLSKVMGAKGNEVSIQLHGIKLFEELVYFPINTANEFFDDPLGTKKGEKKLRNHGFTEKTVDKAYNPIVLDSFEDVWAAHVDKMSLYHGFVLPMEDFDRVYNYRHAVEEGVTDAEGEVYKTKLVDTNESVKVDIENKCGSAATEYIARYMQNLNGGVRGDATEKLFGGILGNFKKTAVLGSGSVVVQQPAAFIRAMAHLKWEDCFDWKSRLGKDGKPSEGLKREMYKYAPVARMKAMGGFDPSVGRTTRQYLFGEYKDGENLLKRGVEGINDKLGKAPEKMDELTWTYIWLCTKRQIHRQHPDLKINSKEFLEKTAERFSYIIRDSQVYDSAMVKPLIMQSKSFFVKAITSFMNEPLKGINQSVRAWLQWKNGKISGKQCARVFATTYCSSLLAGALSAFFYAARDDDEDETYWEKYVTAVTSKAVEGIIPFYSIPFVKDIISVFEGYGAERAEMSLLVDAYQAIMLVLNEDADPWDKLEKGYAKLLNAFGVPASNLVREARAIWRVGETIVCGNKVKATGAGMKYALLEGLPFTKEVKKSKQWENAVAENDAEHIVRLLATYDTEDKAVSAFRSAVQAVFVQGNITEQQAVEFLKVYAGDTAEDAQEKVTQWSAERDTGIAYNDIKDKFNAGKISAQKAKEMCVTYGGCTEEEAQDKITVWRFKREHPDTVLESEQVLKYLEYAKPAGISQEIYSQYADKVAQCESDKDEDGKTIPGSLKVKILDAIDGLPISRKQKDALYYASGYKESSLDEAPWN